MAASQPLIFTPPAGPVGDSGTIRAAVTITASRPVIWYWSSTGDLPTANVVDGRTAPSITFSLFNGRSDDPKECVITLTAEGQTWDITLSAAGGG